MPDKYFRQIRQIVVNLLTNAWESLPNGEGSISVAAGLTEDGSVRLEVTDTGCGIAPENLPKIFDPFYSTKSLGRGLGLAGVQGVVRRAGGLLQTHSTPGKGSTFEILFPATKSPLPELTTLSSK